MKTTYKFTITYESVVDADTGEILETKIVNKSTPAEPKKKELKKDEDPEPKLILGENKFTLTTAAVNLMGLSADDKVDIKYEQGNGTSIPIIGSDESFGTKGGNRLTKTNTVSCRGAKRDELVKYGTEFTLVQHPTKQGLFVLTSDTVKVEQLKGDDKVNISDDFDDLDLSELVDDGDAQVVEIDSSFFKL